MEKGSPDRISPSVARVPRFVRTGFGDSIIWAAYLFYGVWIAMQLVK
jgi:hypothetical protein